MTRAFWLFSGVTGDGLSTQTAFRPDLPLGIGGQYTVPGEIIRLTGPAGPNNHRHLLVGGIAQVDDNLDGVLGEGHRHYVVRGNNAWQQVTVGAQDHTHNLNADAGENLIPDYYMLFWVGSDADALLIEAHPGVAVIVDAIVEEGGNELNILNLDSTLWTTAERTLWESRALNILGVKLPSEVDRGKRLVRLFLGALLSRQTNNERSYRLTSG